MSVPKNNRKRTGEYYVPQKVKDTLLHILPSRKWNQVLISRIPGIKDSLKSAKQKVEHDNILDVSREKCFDLILMVPPFGAKPKDKKILEEYEIPKREKTSESIWLAHAHKILEDGGWLFSWLPNVILNAPHKYKMRKWILSHFQLKAVLDISPTESSDSSGEHPSSILVMKKCHKKEKYIAIMGKICSSEAIDRIAQRLNSTAEIIPENHLDIDRNLRMDVNFNLHRQIDNCGQFTPLDEIAEITNGKCYRKDWVEESDKGTPVLFGGSIKENFISKTELRYSARSRPLSNKHKLKVGDVIIKKVIPTPAAIITKETSDFACSADLIRIRIKQTRICKPEVLCCLLNLSHGQEVLSKIQYNTKIKRINTNALKSLVVPILPNHIQNKIEDMVKSSIQINEDARKKLLSVKKALKAEVDKYLGKENFLYPVSDFAKLTTATLPNSTRNQVVLYSQTRDISDAFGVLESYSKSIMSKLPPMVKQPIKPGDVVITNTGRHIGTKKHRIAVVPHFYSGELITASFTALEFSSSPYYWATVLKHPVTLEEMRKCSKGNLKREDLSNLKVACLPYDRREKFNNEILETVKKHEVAINKFKNTKRLIEKWLTEIGYDSSSNQTVGVVINPENSAELV